MSELQKLVDRVNVIEEKLLAYANELAAELDKPVSTRSIPKCNETWAALASARPKLNKIFHDLSRLDPEVKRPKGVVARKASVLQRELKMARKRLNSWKRIEAIVREQCNPEKTDLRSLRPQFLAPMTIEGAISDLFIDSFHKFANPNPQGDDGYDHDCFADIPLPMNYFAALISVAYRVCLAQKRARPMRFLDVGSGGGTKVLAATTCFEICHGLEYDKAYADAGAHMLNCVMPKRCTNIHGDGLTFEDYSDYDVIYFYRPMRNFDLLRQMEKRIIETSRPGTVIVAPYDIVRDNKGDLGCIEISDSVFVTGITEEEAETLREEASYIGNGVLPVQDLEGEAIGYWRELLRVSAANGFVI